jgi:hypothetical protein
MVILAPESLPSTVNVAYKAFCEPNSVLTVVAFKFNVVPTTVEDTLAPTVVVWLRAFACGVLTPSSSKCAH